MNLFSIKPLEWEFHPDDGDDEEAYDYHEARTPFGKYYIYEYRSSRIEWGFCFDEMYDEDRFGTDSIADAKIDAQRHWCERLSSALEPQSPGSEAHGDCVRDAG